MIENIKKRLGEREYRFTFHAIERCIGRDISPEEVKEVVLSGEVIEDYPKDKYGPSCLVYGKTQEGRILHVQCSIDPVWIITAYDPTLKPDEWDNSFKKRRMK